MDILVWGLIAVGITWPFVGYVSFRLIRGSGNFDRLDHTTCGLSEKERRNKSVCCCGHEFANGWNTPITTDDERIHLATGTLFGWITVLPGLLVLVYWSLDRGRSLLLGIGNILSPKKV